MAGKTLDRLLGPRVTRQDFSANRGRYMLPTILFLLAAAVLVVSMVVPFWKMTLHAPQYPGGLKVRAYVNRLEGDVAEIDGLNHYIGMRPLNEAAKLERAVSIQVIGVLICLILAATFVHNRWAVLAAFPAFAFPFGFLIDLQFWLWNFGQNLDPKAPLSSSVKPFIPPVLGVGRVGQFHTVAAPDVGLILAWLASALVLAGLWAHRRAYKPLVDQVRPLPNQAKDQAVIGCLFGAALLVGDPSASRAENLQDRINAAPDGSVLIVPAGIYEAPVAIDRPLTLEGEPGAVIQGSGSGDLLHINCAGVTIRGLALRGTGESLEKENAAILVVAPRATIENCVLEDDLFGINLRDAHNSVLRNNRIIGKSIDIARRGDAIRLWNSNDCLIEGNEVFHTRDAIVWYSRGVLIRKNHIHDSRYGLHFMYANDNVVEGNRLANNSVGAFLMYSKNLIFVDNELVGNRGPSGYGLGLKDVDGLRAEGNRLIGNRVGLYLDNSPFSPSVNHDISKNTFAYNDIGALFQPSVRRNRLFENAFVENLEQVAVAGSGDFMGNEFTWQGRGNYWSDYKGFDLGNDGIGDIQYKSESLFENLIDREPKLRLFLFSPAQQAVELASNALPTFKPRPKVIDTAPLTRLPVPSNVPGKSSPWPLGAFAGFLTLSSLLTIGATMRRGFGVMPATGRSTDAASASPSVAAMEGAARVLAVENLTKDFGSFRALEDLSFHVNDGEAVALWGKNGAGKTTAIKCILGLHTGRGRITVGGQNIAANGKQARRLIGYVPQELSLPGDLATHEAMHFFARLKKVDPSEVDRALGEVQLLEHREKRVSELSGGMKQRVALAVGLLSNPRLLLLDEMTANLDAASRAGFVELLSRQKQNGKTILFTTHRPDEVVTLADRVLILDQGKLVKESSGSAFLENIGVRFILRLQLDGPIDPALSQLRESGFKARPDRFGKVLVSLAPRDKMEAIRILETAGHRILDFEVEEDFDV